MSFDGELLDYFLGVGKVSLGQLPKESMKKKATKAFTPFE